MNNYRTNVKLSTREKICFSLGDFYGGGFFNIVNFFYLYFLTDVMLINPAWAGLIFTVGKIWDAITDPLMGALSDRTQSRFGRRRVYFLIGLPLILLSFVMMWWPLSTESELSRVLFFLFAYNLANTVYTIVIVPFTALSAELTTDYRQRATLTGVRMMFSLFSSLLCAVAPMLITGAFPPEHIKIGYLVMSIVIGLWFSLPWLAVFFGVREPKALEKSEPHQPILAGMLSTLKVKTFLKYNLLYLSVFVTMDLISVIMSYYLTYILGRRHELQYVLGLLLITEIAFIPLAMMLIKHTNKIFAIIVGNIAWAIGGIASLFIGSGSPSPLLYCLAAYIGASIAFSLVGVNALFGDVTDVGELYFGARIEGAFSGVLNFLRKCASALANGAAMTALSLCGFLTPIIAGQPLPQNPAVLNAIRGILGLSGMVLLLPAIYVCMKWALTERVQTRLIDYLDKKRAGVTIKPDDEREITHLKDSVL